MGICDQMSSEDVLNIFLQFKGWGNPDGDLWFLGLEEGDKDICKDEKNIIAKLHEYNCECSNYDNISDSHYSDRTSTWQIESKLSCELFNVNNKDWRRFMRECLLKSKGHTFLMELYPLPKPTFKCWPETYQHYFGFSSLAEYHKMVEGKRFPVIKDWLQKKNPKYIICFGKKAWDRYKIIFCDVKDWKSEREGLFQMAMRGSQKICLTPFFVNHRMSDAAIHQLVDLLK